MNIKEAQKQIKTITAKIVKEYKPEKIILFGSYAWGKPHEDSDVDLLVVKTSRKRRIDRVRDLRLKLYGNNFPPMDILVYTPGEIKKRLAIGDFFVEDIVSKGKILYGR